MNNIYTRKIAFVLFCIFFALSGSLLSQSSAMGEVSEIIIPANAKMANNNNLYYEVHLLNNDFPSPAFWYKIIFKEDCLFEFTLFPLMEEDGYDFYFFRVAQNLDFCRAVIEEKLISCNAARIYKQYNDAEQSDKFRSKLVNIKALSVKAGDAIYIEVFSTVGNNCGHILDFRTTSTSFVVKVVNDKCAGNGSNATAFEGKYKPVFTEKEAIRIFSNTVCHLTNDPLLVSVIKANPKNVTIQKKQDYDAYTLKEAPKYALPKIDSVKPIEAMAPPVAVQTEQRKVVPEPKIDSVSLLATVAPTVSVQGEQRKVVPEPKIDSVKSVAAVVPPVATQGEQRKVVAEPKIDSVSSVATVAPTVSVQGEQRKVVAEPKLDTVLLASNNTVKSTTDNNVRSTANTAVKSTAELNDSENAPQIKHEIVDIKSTKEKNSTRLDVDYVLFCLLREDLKRKLHSANEQLKDYSSSYKNNSDKAERTELKATIAEIKQQKTELLSQAKDTRVKIKHIQKLLNESRKNQAVGGETVFTKSVYTDDKKVSATDTKADAAADELNTGIIYKIQIGVYKNAISTEVFKGLSPVSSEVFPGGIKYFAGAFRHYKDAQNAKEYIKGMGLADAFVVAYYNGKRVSVKDAQIHDGN